LGVSWHLVVLVQHSDQTRHVVLTMADRQICSYVKQKGQPGTAALSRTMDWWLLEGRFGEVYTDDPGRPFATLQPTPARKPRSSRTTSCIVIDPIYRRPERGGSLILKHGV